jgi:hypothetical protein
VAGIIVLVYVAWNGIGPVSGINTGLIALAINIVVMAVVWAATPKRAVVSSAEPAPY